MFPERRGGNLTLSDLSSDATMIVKDAPPRRKATSPVPGTRRVAQDSGAPPLTAVRAQAVQRTASPEVSLEKTSPVFSS